MTGIVHVMLDDAGYQDFGCYGHPDIQTPHIDAIAAAGTRFTKFLATPGCSTTHAGLMTGYPPQYYAFHRVDIPHIGQRYWLPAYAPTVSRRLQAAGWKTGHFGKTHWGAPPYTLHPANFGWDKFVGNQHGQVNAQFPGMVRYNDAYFTEDTGAPQVFPGFSADVLTERAIGWIQNQVAASEFFYCELHYWVPHEPGGAWNVPEFALYPSPTYTARQRHYYGVISHADTLVGDLVAALSAAGVLDTTIICVGSDNGPEPHDAAHPYSAGRVAPYRGWKTSLMMGGIAVPWVMRGPGFAAGAVDTRFRGFEDWMATCLAVAGYDTSAIPVPLPGRDLRTVPADRYLCREYHATPKTAGVPTPADWEWTVVKADADSRWKLLVQNTVNNLATATKLLYDIDADPGETTDVAAANPAVVAELDSELSAWAATWEPDNFALHDLSPEAPATELEAVTIKPEPAFPRLLIRCVDAADRTAKATLLDKALELPAAQSCGHGFAGTVVTSYGPDSATHTAQSGVPCLVVGVELKQLHGDAAVAARLSAAELLEFNEMVLDAHAEPVQ